MGESAVYAVTLEKMVAVWRDPGIKNRIYICFARLEREFQSNKQLQKKRNINAQSKW
jgi:hypothetical protein